MANKVIVVDDEPLMLEGWKSMVDWGAYGFELCGTATDGEEALGAIRSCSPDLVVTDIRMPVMDGLELIRTMKEEMDSRAKIVIVSGYSEFQYAQKAIRYQVDHYLLKPLVTEEVHDVLQELSAALEHRRMAEEADGKEREAAAAAALVRLLQHGGMSAVQEASRLLGADERTVCRLVLAESHGCSGSDGDPVGIRARAGAFADACFLKPMRTVRFEEAPGRAGLLVMDGEEDDGAFVLRVTSAMEALTTLYGEMSFYCSGSMKGIASVTELYRQALEARSRAMPFRNASVRLYRERTADAECRIEDMTAGVQELVRSIEDNDAERICRSVDSLTALFIRTGAARGWMDSAVAHIRGELLRKHAEQEEAAIAFPEWMQVWDDRVPHSAPSFADSMKKLCLRAARHLAVRKKVRHSSAVAEAVDYLKRHYQSKIQLQEMAERLGLSPVYFGQQFKRETGCHFNDYIHRLRIDEAKKMLRRTDMKVAVIAAALGYHDTDYFTAKFKALTGESPSSYKNKCKGDRHADKKTVFP
jgi:two-component system response regulator YesN